MIFFSTPPTFTEQTYKSQGQTWTKNTQGDTPADDYCECRGETNTGWTSGGCPDVYHR